MTNASLTKPSSTPGTNCLIRLHDINKHYETKAGRTNILNHITMDVRDGEFLSIMGPSGAGKTTLLNILGMFDADWSGSFEFVGQPIHALKTKVRRELGKQYVGFVFQQYHLLDDLTVYENLEIPLSYRNVKRSERAAIVADALDRFGMVAKKDLYPTQLSGGQQQLVAVARATISSPKLILADEPTGSLHSSQGKMIMELLSGLNAAGTTIMQVTHSEENAGYGHRTVELHDGWLVEP
ncbi:MAG: ATP-binding cassette domain-containing protein [Gemmatimonas sp.]|nr:ATP-binding cassette domain-containing protein [Gemmatimonas sp.]